MAARIDLSPDIPRTFGECTPMKRTVFLTVEATGLDRAEDRVVEIVALEAVDSKLSGNQFHVLLDPQHPIREDAELCTGYNNGQLRGLPRFREIRPAFLRFLQNSTLITFNSGWSFQLINAELKRERMPPLAQYVMELIDAKSQVAQLGLNPRLTLDKLAILFDCREPIQPCTQTWRECFLLAQLFPKLARADMPAAIVSLESSIRFSVGPNGKQYVEIASIAEPWRTRFINWLSAGVLVGDERMHRCQLGHWQEWIDQEAGIPTELRHRFWGRPR